MTHPEKARIGTRVEGTKLVRVRCGLPMMGLDPAAAAMDNNTRLRFTPSEARVLNSSAGSPSASPFPWIRGEHQ